MDVCRQNDGRTKHLSTEPCERRCSIPETRNPELIDTGDSSSSLYGMSLFKHLLERRFHQHKSLCVNLQPFLMF